MCNKIKNFINKMEYKIYYTKHQTDCKIWLEIINSLEKNEMCIFFQNILI